MRRQKLIEAAVVAGIVALWGGVAHADGGAANSEEFSARLSGFQELGALNAETGAILTDGTGKLQLDLDKKSQMATYTLTFSGLNSAVTQAHIHFGKVHVPGGIFVWLSDRSGDEPDGGDPVLPIGGRHSDRYDHGNKYHRGTRAERASWEFRRSHGCAHLQYCLCQCPHGEFPEGRDPRPGS
jgi:CHRD domain